MRRVAVIADIHANLPALEAVITDLEQHPVDEVIVGGDLVGRGPQGSAVIKRIRELGWPSIRGNHEDYLLGFRRKTVPQDWLAAQEWCALRWMAAELEEDDVAYIDTLPFSTTSSIAPQIRVVHGSPSSYSDGIGYWTEPETRRAHFDAVVEPILVCGHTHRPLLQEYDDGYIVNVGSVGLPFNDDPRAQYVIFTLPNDDPKTRPTIEFRKVEYSRQKTLIAYQSTGFLEEGGITAALLKLELLNAAPYLVPFDRWIIKHQLPHNQESMHLFLHHIESKRTQQTHQTIPCTQEQDQ